MGPWKKLRCPSAAAESRAAAAAATSITAPPAVATTLSPSSAPAALPSPAPATVPSSAHIQPLFPVMRLVEKPSSSKPSSPRRVFVSISSDLRLVVVKPAAIPPTSLIDFRRPRLKIALGRLDDVPMPGAPSSQSLESAAEPRVCAAEHVEGPAVRVKDESKQTILLIADSEDERDGLLMSLRLRVAPWPILGARMKEEMAAPAFSSSPLARAMRELLGGATGVSTAVKNMKSDVMLRKAWENAGTIAEPSMLAATFAQSIAGVAGTAEEVERLAKPLGGLAIVGCVFTFVALSAKVVVLFSLEKEGRLELAKAGNYLREASLLLVRWLFSILSSGFHDEDDLVERVFDILADCWKYGDELEQYLLQGRVGRVRKAEDVSIIISKTASLRAKLLGAGLLKNFAGLQNQVEGLQDQVKGYQDRNENRFYTLESENTVVDSFRPRFPDPVVLSTGLVADAALQLARLKEAVSPSSETSSAHESRASTRRVALTSVDGEGGVGKTSTCKLLCADPDIRKLFDEGAIIWIEVGKDASVDAVKEKLAIVVKDCGGDQSAQQIRESKIPGVGAAVEIARLYFSKHRIMLVLDNVWHPRLNIGVNSWVDELTQIASVQGSVVIMTTRFEKLAERPGFERVRVGPYDLESDKSSDWHLAEKLYDFLLGDSSKKRATSVYVSNRREALSQSCGIPLGIATFAGLVRDLRKRGHDADEVLKRIKRRSLGLASKNVGDEQQVFTLGHYGLFAAMVESLIFLDEQVACRVKLKPSSLRRDGDGRDCRVLNAAYDDFPGKELSSRYAALHMLLESSPNASFPVLAELWHVTGIEEADRIEEAEQIASFFVDIGLARWQKSGEKGLVLHDLQYEFCFLSSRMSSAGILSKFDPQGQAVNGHALFLSSCKSLLLSKYGEADFTQWARFCFGDSKSNSTLREYVQNGLFRHLCLAKPDQDVTDPGKYSSAVETLKQEILSVLCSLCWLIGRTKSKWGRSCLMGDFDHAFGSLFFSDDDTYFLHKLRETMMRVPHDDLLLSDGTLASSLVQVAQSVEAENPASSGGLFERVSENAVENVLGAWLKPVSGCFLSFEREFVRDAHVSSRMIISLHPVGDGKHFVSLDVGHAVRIHDYSDMDTVRVLNKDKVLVHRIAVVHRRHAESSLLAFWQDSGENLRCSEITLDEAALSAAADSLFVSDRGILGKGGSMRTCLSVSKVGKFVAVVCGDGTVGVWELDVGSSGIYSLSYSFSRSLDGGEEGSKKSVVVSRSGQFVAVSSSGGDLVFWRREIGNSKGVARLVRPASESNGNHIVSLFLSNDETFLVVILSDPAAYEFWDVETGECRFPLVELPQLKEVCCANLVGSSDGGEGGLSLVIGGSNGKGGSLKDHLLVEYSIGEELEEVQKWRFSASIVSVCSADFSDETGLSAFIVGCVDGRVCLLRAHAPDASRSVERSERGMRTEKEIRQTSSPVLGEVSAVAVMPDTGRVVAGHSNGLLSLWSGEDGSFIRVIDTTSKERLCCVTCIDVCADGSVAGTGNMRGTAFVWDISDESTWTVRCVLGGNVTQITMYTVINSVAIVADTNRAFTVNMTGELRVWDAESGGAALCVFDTGLKFDATESHILISPDKGHVTMASQQIRRSTCYPWKAIVIDIVECRMVFESDEHRELDALWAEIDSSIWQTETIRSWKQAAVWAKIVCDLPGYEEESGKRWKINRERDSRVWCGSYSAGGEYSDKASISFDSFCRSIAAQWLSHPEEDSRRRAVVACQLDGKSAPAVLHFITPTVRGSFNFD